MDYRRRSVSKSLDIESINLSKFIDVFHEISSSVRKRIPLCVIDKIKKTDYINSIMSRICKFVWKTTTSHKR